MQLIASFGSAAEKGRPILCVVVNHHQLLSGILTTRTRRSRLFRLRDRIVSAALSSNSLPRCSRCYTQVLWLRLSRAVGACGKFLLRC